jgi:hypothetical protein
MKLGRDKFLLNHWVDNYLSEPWVVKLYNRFIGVIFDQFSSILGYKKSGRFVIFWVDFWHFWTENWAIGIYRKTGPTKSTVLGPRPPPWRNHKIYRKNTIFHDFGAFNRAGKSVSKIGIYALPPLKSEIYRIFIKIYRVNCSGNSLRPITVLFSLYFGIGIVLLLFRFLVLSRIGYSSFSWFAFCVSAYCWLFWWETQIPTFISTGFRQKEQHGGRGRLKGPVYRRRHRSRQ